MSVSARIGSRPFECEDCGGKPDCPMIKQEHWMSVASQSTLLCLECFEKRFSRQIALSDLMPCLWTDVLLKIITRVKTGQL